MHLPQAMLERLRAGLGAAALIAAVTPAAGCASTRADAPAQAPFAGMGKRANPTAPTPAPARAVHIVAPGTRPFAQPVAQPVQPVPVVQPIAPPPPPRTWECGPCGMG